jgi:hypothetical protein
VVPRLPRLTLVAVRGGRDASHAGAARLHAVVVGRGHGPSA